MHSMRKICLLVDFQPQMLPAVLQTALGTPGVDFPTLNPFTMKTRVKYGLSAAALNTEITPFTEVHPPHAVLSARMQDAMLLRCMIVYDCFAVDCFTDLAHPRHPSGQCAALTISARAPNTFPWPCLERLGCKQEGQECSQYAPASSTAPQHGC